jgi:hypothetical protein
MRSGHMPQAIDSIASDIEHLTERLRELENRVVALERGAGKPVSAQPELTAAGIHKARPVVPADMPSGPVPVVGKAVLGIAGAYLLRAIAESGAIPRLPILIIAIVYAGLWLVWAVRTHARNHFASLAYGVTAVLILSPLLWESTVRFRFLPSSHTAVVLVAFLVLAFALAWQNNLQLIPWVATLATVVTAWALIIATHDLVPLTAALLAVALATEAAACLGHRLSLRGVPAIAANLAVLLLIHLMTSSAGVPEDYSPVSPTTIILICFALLAIYGGSIAIRSFGLRNRITTFEIVQVVVAFVLATFGTIRASAGSAAPALGLFFMLLAAVCYWGALSRFAPEPHALNRRVCATWAAALVLAGSFLLFSANVFSAKLQVSFLCLAAVAAAFLYTRTGKLSLGLHASCYLAGATVVSPLPGYAGNALAGTVPAAPDAAVWIVAGSSVLCYAIGSRVVEEHRGRRFLWVVPAVLVGLAGAAMAVVAIVWLATGRLELTASRLSMIRTVINCLLAIAFGFLGSRWKHEELGWAAYAAVAFGTLKLLFEDLRFGNAASLVVSLLFYGLILILLPRLMRPDPIEP